MRNQIFTFPPQALVIGLVTLLLQQHGQVVNGFSCWHCKNYDLTEPSQYDEHCGDAGYYSNNEDHMDSNTWSDDRANYTCGTEVWSDGHVYRWLQETTEHINGECNVYDDYTNCYCSDDLCNSELCEDCVTPTVEPSSSREPATTALFTTEAPGNNLHCYSCIGCSTVDDSTPVIEDPSYRSCTTTLLLANAEVLRGASPEVHQDGECLTEGDILTCYCDYDLCNAKT